MNNIYFICDNCGIETNGFTFVNGMKFCAKCYHQIFGKDNQQTEIAQLKQQLAEKDKEIEKLKQQNTLLENENGKLTTELIMGKYKKAQKEVSFGKQLAIHELERVKEDCFNQKELVDFGHVACFMVDIADILEIINNQIKELRGE